MDRPTSASARATQAITLAGTIAAEYPAPSAKGSSASAYTATAISAPYTPSHVLPGLIAGASLRFPNRRPTKYAAESATHTIAINARSKAGERACSCTTATQVAISASQPTRVSTTFDSTRQPKYSHAGAITTQNRVAAPQIETTNGSGHPPAASKPPHRVRSMQAPIRTD